MRFEEIIDLTERTAAEEAPVGGQGAGMGRLNHQAGIGRIGGGFGFFLRLGAPEDEGHRLGKFSNGGDHLIGEILPTEVLMAVGLALLHREDGIEEKHPLFGPVGQIAGGRRRHAYIAFPLLINIDQGGGQLDTGLYGKSQSVSLSRFMVRVLSYIQLSLTILLVDNMINIKDMFSLFL